MAIWYSVIFVLYGALVIGTGTRNPWTVALCIMWGILSAWAWLGVRYFVRNARGPIRTISDSRSNLAGTLREQTD